MSPDSRSRCDWCDRYFTADTGSTVCGTCLAEHNAILDGFTQWTELGQNVGDGPTWLLSGYLAAGHVTLLSGKPKAGKSTLACAIAEAVDNGETTLFLGRYVGDGPAVYVSEEGPMTLAPKLRASTRSVALTRERIWPKPSWTALVAAAVEKAMEIEAVLLVIDSLAFWACFREGQEKDAGAAQATMDALTAATRAGLGVLLVHHQRKTGGDEGDAVRGSGAILGAVDLSVELERLGDAPTHRRLVAVGRWTTPPVLVIDRDSTGRYRLVGRATGREEAAALGDRERLLAAMPPQDPGATEAELVELLGHPRNVAKPLRQLVASGYVARTGDGKRGSPYRYRVSPPASSSTDGGANGSRFSSTPIGGRERELSFEAAPPASEEKPAEGVGA